MNGLTHFLKASMAYDRSEKDILDFGYHMMLAIDTEGRTLREMSIEKCGDESLEDKFGRWVMAARFVDSLQGHPLYEDARDWLTHSHFTELYKIATIEDAQAALVAMQESFVRNVADKKIIKVKPVDFLRAKHNGHDNPSTAELFHRVWRVVAKALPEAYSVWESKGSLATHRDLRRIRVLKLALAEFQAEDE